MSDCLICALCGVRRNQLHRDHIIPKYAGGPDVPANIQLICANCHEDKTIADRYRYPFRHTEETKQKIGRAHKGRKWSESHKANLAASARRRGRSAQFIEAGRTANLGRKFSPDHCSKIAVKSSLHQHSEQTRLKIAEDRQRYFDTPEGKEAARKGQRAALRSRCLKVLADVKAAEVVAS